MELIVYPAIYAIWKWNFELKPALEAAQETGISSVLAAGLL